MDNPKHSRVARRQMKQPKKKPIFKRILLVICLLILASGIGITGLFAYYISTAPEIDVEKLSDPFSSKIYDKDGNLFADLGDVKRTKIEFDDLPDILVDAVVAAEDARFFKHFGIDLRRMAGAVVANIQRGFGAEGASTITQQVVENAFLTKDKKLKRKVQEQWLAIKLEREFSKEQILEMYLNKIYYGSGAYGVAKAAEIYFGKTNLHDLTLIEAAILAGLPQRPSAYDPFVNPDLTAKRVETVLKLMVRHGKISEEEADEARQIDIASVLTDKKPPAKDHDAFLQKVREEIYEKLDGVDIDTDGLKIYTTMDKKAQEYVEFLLTDHEENPIDFPDEDLQAGFVVLDTSTGAIRAIGGSRNRENIEGYNYAIQGGRQPGSTAKPIVAFGPAIEFNKISTYHQIHDDEPYVSPGTDAPIHNWDDQYRGWVSVRYALLKSLNVPSVKTFLEVDAKQVKEFGERLGIQFANDQVIDRDVIGGTATNVTPLQLAGAYRAFANEGIYNEPYAVERVEFPDGQVYDLRPESEAVMADYTAYMVTDMLKSVITHPEGTGRAAQIQGIPIAGKTGTTNVVGKDGANNSWFVGYSSNYTISIWVGYDEHNRIIPRTHERLPIEFFRETMVELSKDLESKDFQKPDSVVEVAIEKGTNPPMLPSEFTPKDQIVTELFVKGTEPKAVSEKYDQLDPVRNLQASYDEEDEIIRIEWQYDQKDEVLFEVNMQKNDESMKNIAMIEETTLEISNVDEGATYTIEVVVTQSDGSLKSDPVSVRIQIPEKEPEELPAVQNLSSTYDENRKVIDVTWTYDGPKAVFKVLINNGEQEQLVRSNGLEISGALPGATYRIKVIPIGTSGKTKDIEGPPQTIEQRIPEEETNDPIDDPIDEPNHENDENEPSEDTTSPNNQENNEDTRDSTQNSNS